MIEFLAANMGTIFVAIILVTVTVTIILNVKKDKKSGKSSCGCGCSGCPNSALCHGKPISKLK